MVILFAEAARRRSGFAGLADKGYLRRKQAPSGGLNRLREKGCAGWNSVPQGLKPHFAFIAVMNGLKPVPFDAMSFRAPRRGGRRVKPRRDAGPRFGVVLAAPIY